MLWRAETLDASLYLILYCEPGSLTNEALIDAYQKTDTDSQLLLLRRIGKAGPDPPVLAVWGAPTYVALEALIRKEDCQRWSVLDLGIYRSFGNEIL